MMRAMCAVIFLAMACWMPTFAWAQPSPLPMLEQTSDAMIAALKQNKAHLRRDPHYVETIVNRILTPRVDLNAMSRSVMGREAWMQASPSQRQRFIRGFTRLVIRTYSAALSAYNDQEVKFYPLREGSEEGGRVEVRSIIIQRDGPEIPVSYRLIWNGQAWKVYDFTVEGVSMISSFRSQFSHDLANGDIERLLAKIDRHNERN